MGAATWAVESTGFTLKTACLRSQPMKLTTSGFMTFGNPMRECVSEGFFGIASFTVPRSRAHVSGYQMSWNRGFETASRRYIFDARQFAQEKRKLKRLQRRSSRPSKRNVRGANNDYLPLPSSD